MAGEAIFIGYRRDDTADVAGRIYDAMALRFGKNRIFKDVDNIGPGVDFGDYIKSVLPRCRVALVLIGPHWLESKDERGRRRIDDEHDWVRIEIETALATPDILVVPVLVNGARMPRSEDVPESLRSLLRRNAAIIRRDPDFHDDVERLATALRSSISTGILDLSKIGGKAARPAPARAHAEKKINAPLLIGGAIAAVALVAVGFWVSRHVPTQTIVEQSEPSPTDWGRRDESAAPHTQPVPPPEMVRISGRNFEVGRYEVTFALWDACVAAGGCGGYSPSDNGWGRGDRPVINVSWNDAQGYVQWLSQRTGQRYRLLTSEEWEIAARAGSTTNFSWGDEDPVCDERAPNGANFSDCTDNRAQHVGSFQMNGLGLFDMHGNVWEWVEDCFNSVCAHRVYRGGSWVNGPQVLRSGSNWDSPWYRDNGLGFRVARTASL
jgi:hypothetical protein